MKQLLYSALIITIVGFSCEASTEVIISTNVTCNNLELKKSIDTIVARVAALNQTFIRNFEGNLSTIEKARASYEDRTMNRAERARALVFLTELQDSQIEIFKSYNEALGMERAEFLSIIELELSAHAPSADQPTTWGTIFLTDIGPALGGTTRTPGGLHDFFEAYTTLKNELTEKIQSPRYTALEKTQAQTQLDKLTQIIQTAQEASAIFNRSTHQIMKNVRKLIGTTIPKSNTLKAICYSQNENDDGND